MKTILVVTAGVALAALAGCSRNNDTSNQVGVAKGAAGLQVNALSAAADCMPMSDINRPPEDFPPEQRVQIVSCVNAAAARQVNAQLPRMMDEVTRLDRITTEGPLLTYHATVLRAASSLPAGSGERLASTARRTVCANPQMRQNIQIGGQYGYRWVDNQGVLIGEVRIDGC